MALIDCANPGDQLGLDAVKGTEWQARLKEAGLTQKRLATLTGVTENTISRQMKGELPVPGYMAFIIAGWSGLTPERQAEWERNAKELKRIMKGKV